jgi:diaminohydroxyphosphoribosylaminopyrimidine deaminase/5-amino-6-(5-phosphoribosylamino)uracil reductase
MSRTVDEKWMRQALGLAARGRHTVSPNPCVGAVIVRGGKKLGEGFHRRAGEPHAEVLAIADAKRKGRALKGATLYVTFEPCCTRGRTPACTGAILEEGFSRVVVAATDPNPAHSGRAYGLLRKRGIKVTTGVLERESNWLNRAFNRWITTGRPWVTLKLAMTLDGYLALPKGEGRWVSGPESRKEVQELRACSDAILVGAGTVRADNPKLTVRGVPGARQPWRVVMAGKGPVPRKGNLFADRWKNRTLVFRGKTPKAVLRDLGKRGVTKVLLEGGATLADAFLKADCVDEVVFYYAPKVVAGGKGLPFSRRREGIVFESTDVRLSGGDLRFQGLVARRD